ncbi:hypothetical protein IEQ34_003061 [Dendrobium chrysotoxum]|uniref:S-acyltransferase n=1 Tax=Dendrobium chrysotoxum TaxID=161865 RepID=A0AAV7HIZ0_DENCH|nr:hypothetical protein IEQ34_003061 [Dendrobium chrysotoxum]
MGGSSLTILFRHVPFSFICLLVAISGNKHFFVNFFFVQVVAIAVFLALGFAFYVFFLPFVGKKVVEYVVMAIYTPLVGCAIKAKKITCLGLNLETTLCSATCVFCLYICCAAINPGDTGVFKSKKYLKAKGYRKGSREEGLIIEDHGPEIVNKILDDDIKMGAMGAVGENSSQRIEKSPEQKTNEDGMFYCCLCEVEVKKHSKHCRVCDKCVDHFDHHCRWLNNCIGRKNYGKFFLLMISAILLDDSMPKIDFELVLTRSPGFFYLGLGLQLILQWSIGVMVLILCFLDRKRYSMDIMSKLGSSFSLAPFTVVVASCTFLAMLATLPLAQLFFFHVLLIKKGISTYEYIVALREQEQGVGQQSPQMSSISSLTGFSSASSFNAFQRGSWCTPPRLFLEDESDVIPQEINMAVNSDGKKIMPDEARKRSTGNIKISPWTLARLNAEEVSKAAAQARKKSKILQPIVKQVPLGHETDVRIGESNMVPKLDNRRRASHRGSRLPTELPLEPLAKISAGVCNSTGDELATESSSCLAPLQLEARSAFRPNRATSTVTLASSPDSSLDSPHLHPFRISSSGAEDSQGPISLPSTGAGAEIHKGVEFLRSTSDGYEASGGEDSDMVPSRIVHRSFNWSSVIFNSGP